MTASIDPKIFEFLASRICHDLVSPVAAVNNGCELIEELGEDAGPEAMDLVASSAQQAASKLQVFRLAYGAGGSETHVSPADVKTAYARMISHEKVDLEWDLNNFQLEELKRGQCKILLNILMLSKECMPRGGTISVELSEDKKDIIVRGQGDDAKISDVALAALDGSIDEEQMDPRLVHAFITGQFASYFGFPIEVSGSGDGTVQFTLGSND